MFLASLTSVEIARLSVLVAIFIIAVINLIFTIKNDCHGGKVTELTAEVVDTEEKISEAPVVDPAPAPDVDMSKLPVKFFVTCICKKNNKANVYRSFITDDFTLGDPSQEELTRLKEKVMSEDKSYVDCTILFFGKLRG